MFHSPAWVRCAAGNTRHTAASRPDRVFLIHDEHLPEPQFRPRQQPRESENFPALVFATTGIKRQGWVISRKGKIASPAHVVRLPPPGAYPRLAEKRCAAQAEYSRLAAQAYSPSDAMSQAPLGLGGNKKVQRREHEIRPLKRGIATDVSRLEGGAVLQIFPAVSDLAA